MIAVITSILAVIGMAVLVLVLGVGIGVGVAMGFEIVMRLSGSNRTVLLTWANTKVEEPRP